MIERISFFGARAKVSDKGDTEKTMDLGLSEIESYFDLARTTRDRSRSLLESHFKKEFELSDEDTSKMCEIHALSYTFYEFLERTFKVGLAKKGDVFRVKLSSSQSMIQMILAIKVLRLELAAKDLSLEAQ